MSNYANGLLGALNDPLAQYMGNQRAYSSLEEEMRRVQNMGMRLHTPKTPNSDDDLVLLLL